MTTTTDADLITETRAGNMDALDELYRRHSQRATYYAMSLTHNRPDAEDLVAESFLRMWESIRKGRTPLRPYSYLCRAIHNRFLDQMQHNAHISEGRAPSLVTPDIAVGIVEHDALVQAFVALCPRWRVALWETVIEGLETAAVSAPTANAAAGVVYRARHALREAYLQASA
jgi:RNA polymerase sigma factor (sigma-70 family)